MKLSFLGGPSLVSAWRIIVAQLYFTQKRWLFGETDRASPTMRKLQASAKSLVSAK